MSKVEQLRALREARFSHAHTAPKSTPRRPPSRPTPNPFTLVTEAPEVSEAPAAASKVGLPATVVATVVVPEKSVSPDKPAPSFGSRPAIEPGKPILAYSDEDLRFLMLWLQSTHPQASAEELITMAMGELGFTRRGKTIVTRLAEAI